MEKSWYLIVEGSTQGPYTLEELMQHEGFSPDALVWCEGMVDWMPAKEVKELKNSFKDRASPPPVIIEEADEETTADPEGEVILAAKKEPPFFLIWLIIAALIFTYLAIQFFFNV